MDISIEVNQIKKYFFQTSIKDNEMNEDNEDNEYNEKKYISKICVNNFFSVNEVNICEIISKLPYYSNYYYILCDFDYISLGELTEKVIKKLDLDDMSNEEKYLLFKYKNINYIKLNDFLFHLSTPKLFILNVLESYSYLLQSLIKLNKNKICYFNLSTENIIFTIKNGQKPILTNFQKSIDIQKLTCNYISEIIKETYDYTYKPIEVHVLFYLIHNELNTISYSLIEEITEKYVKNLHILTFFSQKYQQDYKLLCVKTLEKYVNRSKIEIISDIIERRSTWDNYSLSVLYFHILCSISRVFLLKGTFLSKLTVELSKNICPDSSKRESLENTLQMYEKLYSSFNDWSFINKISSEKMNKLFQVLLE